MKNYPPPVTMKDNNLTILLDYMSDGYVEWTKKRCRRRIKRYKTLVVLSLLLAVGVNTTAFAIPMRYSSYSGSYAPDAVPMIDYLIYRQ